MNKTEIAAAACADMEQKTGLSLAQLTALWEDAQRALEHCSCAGCAMFRIGGKVDTACFKGQKDKGEIMQEIAAVSGLSPQEVRTLATEGVAAFQTCSCAACAFIRASSSIDMDLYRKGLEAGVVEMGQTAVNAAAHKRSGRPPQ